ncbi:MAG: hypothetical protein Q4C47_04575 [Planctomycetia bacterium]|nr:hypothetical protein [Planctomycetia bacterium]
MPETFLPENIQLQLSIVLFWLGYACVTGVLAVPFAPGRTSRSMWGVLVCGAMGSCLGPFILSQCFQPAETINPLHPFVLLVSVLCCVALLWIQRLLQLRAAIRETVDGQHRSPAPAHTPTHVGRQEST